MDLEVAASTGGLKQARECPGQRGQSTTHQQINMCTKGAGVQLYATTSHQPSDLTSHIHPSQSLLSAVLQFPGSKSPVMANLCDTCHRGHTETWPQLSSVVHVRTPPVGQLVLGLCYSCMGARHMWEMHMHAWGGRRAPGHVAMKRLAITVIAHNKARVYYWSELQSWQLHTGFLYHS